MPPTAPSLAPFSVRPNPHLLEIPAWSWLEELSAQQGRSLTLGEVPDSEWSRIRDSGFDLVWLMGVWQRSPVARYLPRVDPNRFAAYDYALPGWKLADVVGSPYAVHDYHPDPRIGTWSDIDNVRSKLCNRGMGLILDFLPNHTALDHPWVDAHPEFFIEGNEEDFRRDPSAYSLIERPDGQLRFLAHGRDPYFSSWQDTAQLNLFDSGARQALLGVIRQIAEHADGLRCDMAMLVLNDVFSHTWGEHRLGAIPAGEFWTEAIAAAPGLVWLAEAYWEMETRLRQLGFRFTYDKPFYDSLRAGNASALRRCLAVDFASQQRFARFLENHDEQRSAAVFGAYRLQAAAALSATAPGLRFFFHGQFDGRKIHQPVELARAADEPPDTAIRSLYQRLLPLTNEDVFHTGQWSLIGVESVGNDTFNTLIAFQWRSAQSWKLVAVNIGSQTADGRIALGEQIDHAPRYLFSDQLNDINYVRTIADLASGLYIRLDPWRAHIFDIRPSA